MRRDRNRENRISLKEAFGITSDEPVRPVKMDTVKAWLHIKRTESVEGSESADVLDEIMDIIEDYEAGKDMQICQQVGVIRKDPRTLICKTCTTKVMPGDMYCRGCGGKLDWNLRN